jgi:hypothetical protein
LICLSVETASTRVVLTVGANAPTTSGEEISFRRILIQMKTSSKITFSFLEMVENEKRSEIVS